MIANVPRECGRNIQPTMEMNKTLAIFLAAASLVATLPVRASESGDKVFADFSLWSPSLQAAEPSDSVRAFRLALYGRNADVKGVDISVVGVTDGDFVGAQWNGIGIIKGNAYGLIGALYSGLAYVGGDVNGVSAAFVNIGMKDLNGAEIGIWNQVGAEMTGLQLGIVNYAAALNGVQLGLVNVATGGYGLQVGIVNYFKGSDVFDVLPLVNFNF